MSSQKFPLWVVGLSLSLCVACSSPDGGSGAGGGGAGDSGSTADVVQGDSSLKADSVAATDSAAALDAGMTADAGPVADAALTDTAVTDAGPTGADAGQSTDSTAAPDALQTADAGPGADAMQTADAAGGSPVVCAGGEPKFPPFDKSCSVDADCVTSLHQINCCGTLIAVGMNKAALPGFEAAEKTCQSQYPGCGCASMMTVAEDGVVVQKPEELVAHCAAGVCVSKVNIDPKECKSVPGGAPQAWRWCQQDADCDSVLHMVDCCGTQVLWGVAKTAKAGIEATETACGKYEPICDCMPKPTAADDGKPVSSGKVQSKCTNGGCWTSVL